MIVRTALVGLVMTLASHWASAQAPPAPTEPEFQLIEAAGVRSLEKALLAAGERGFVVRAGGNLRLVLQRDGAPHAYAVVATRSEETLIKELNAAGARGFGVVREAVTTVGPEWILVLEKKSSGQTFTYTGVKGDGQAEKGINAARKSGAQIVAVLGKAPGEFGRAFRGNPTPLLVLQHDAGAPRGQNERQYRVVSTKLTGSLEKEVQEAAASGFRPIGSGYMSIVLERDADPPQKPRDYRVIATRRASTSLLEIEALSNDGFRIGAMPESLNEWLFVMERDAAMPERFEYLLVELRQKTIDQLMRGADKQGYRVLGLVEQVVVLEKKAAKP
jgi:hypothetical protein